LTQEEQTSPQSIFSSPNNFEEFNPFTKIISGSILSHRFLGKELSHGGGGGEVLIVLFGSK
jgi:hypothetical protein